MLVIVSRNVRYRASKGPVNSSVVDSTAVPGTGSASVERILTGYASLRSSVRYLGARAFVACTIATNDGLRKKLRPKSLRPETGSLLLLVFRHLK